MTEQTESFIDNLNQLRSAVKKVSEMAEPDVDQLIPLVEQGTQAYKACQKRIDQVESILGLGDKSENESE